MMTISIRLSKGSGLLLAGLLCCLVATSAHAQMENFDFSFVGDPTDSTVDGTVAGEIIGVENNASSVPEDIIITSAPAGLGINTSVPYSLKENGWTLFEIAGDEIAVSDGAVTSDTNYEANLDDFTDGLDLNATVSFEPQTSMVLNGLDFERNYVANYDGFSGATYTYAGLTVPEPSTWALLLGGLSALAFCHARLKRSASK